jgi:hypothetical protein
MMLVGGFVDTLLGPEITHAVRGVGSLFAEGGVGFVCGVSAGSFHITSAVCAGGFFSGSGRAGGGLWGGCWSLFENCTVDASILSLWPSC